MDLLQPPPLNEDQLKASFRSYETALQRLDQSALFAELARVNGLLQEQAQTSLTSLLLRERTSEIDRLDQLSPETESQSSDPADRPRPSPQSPPQMNSWQLLSGTSRLGPRLAAKLVVSSARAQAKRTGSR